jgi:dihydroneopterin aldolase
VRRPEADEAADRRAGALAPAPDRGRPQGGSPFEGRPEGSAVYVTGIEFEASHGFTAAERRSTRRFRLAIEIRRDLEAAARSDRIQDTVDYRAICALAVEIGTTRTFRLLEALAGAIADAIQERHPEAGLTVTVEKIAPPCPGAPLLSGVRLSREPR